jgi:hypothetical protein
MQNKQQGNAGSQEMAGAAVAKDDAIAKVRGKCEPQLLWLRCMFVPTAPFTSGMAKPRCAALPHHGLAAVHWACLLQKHAASSNGVPVQRLCNGLLAGGCGS